MKDEYSFILDRTHLDIRNVTELAEAAGRMQTTILEKCSEEDVPFSEYAATRQKCVHGLMEELGQNPIFNDIMDVVSASQLARSDLKVRFADSEAAIPGAGHGFYLSNEDAIKEIYDIESSLAGRLSVGDVVVGGAKNSNALRGTVLHEFTHFALDAVFKNNCAPYSVIASPGDFNQIVLQTMRNLYSYYLPDTPLNEQLTAKELANSLVGLVDPELEKVVAVFKGAYEAERYNAEFVVRLPHILAEFYINENYNLSPKFQACFAPLILYWKDVITPEMRKHVDRHSKGHLLTTDRVYEENMLAHSGEYYLLREGEKTPADAALAIMAKDLIDAIDSNDKVKYSELINGANDDRLPRIAMAQAISQNKLEIFNLAFAKIEPEHKKYLGSIWVKALRNGRYDMAEQIRPYIKDRSYLVQMLSFALERKSLFNKLLLPFANDPTTLMEIVSLDLGKQDSQLSKLLTEKILEMDAGIVSAALKRAIDKISLMKPQNSLEYVKKTMMVMSHFGNRDTFVHMLPHLERSSEFLKQALNMAVRMDRADLFKQMLPLIKTTQEFDETSNSVMFQNKLDLFKLMLPMIEASPKFKKNVMTMVIYQDKLDMFKLMLPMIETSSEFDTAVFNVVLHDKTDLFKLMLPMIEASPEYQKVVLFKVIYYNKAEIFKLMFPILETSPKLMEEAFNMIVNFHKVDILIQILPLIQKSPNYTELMKHLSDAATKFKDKDILSIIREAEGVKMHIASTPEPTSASSFIMPSLPTTPGYEKQALPDSGTQQTSNTTSRPVTPDFDATLTLAAVGIAKVTRAKIPGGTPVQDVITRPVIDVPLKHDEPKVDWPSTVLKKEKHVQHTAPQSWPKDKLPTPKKSAADDVIPPLVDAEKPVTRAEKFKAPKPVKKDRLSSATHENISR